MTSASTIGRVLLIEGDADTRETARSGLHAAGWVVSEASTGDHGLTVALESHPDVIVCGLDLPDAEASEIVKRLAADSATATIPVLLAAAQGDTADLVVGMEAGAHDFLAKPFDMVELDVRCRAALRVSHQHQRVLESEHELRLLAENVTELVLRSSVDGIIRYASPSSLRKLGWEPDELVGRRFAELFHPDDLEPRIPRILKSIDDVATVTRRFARADGSFIWLETRVRLLEGPDGDLEVFSVGRDVTDRVAANAALAESEAAYRRIVDLAAEGIMVVDDSESITFANARLGEMLGLPADELIGRSPLEFMDDEGRAIAADHLARLRAGITESGDFRFVRRNGTPLWTGISSAPILDEHGRFAGSIGMLADLTERHEHEEALARSEARYRALLDHLPDTVALVYDRDLRTVVAAGAGLAPRGYDAATMLGRHFSEFVTEEDAEVLQPAYDAAFDGRATTMEVSSKRPRVDDLVDVVPITASEGSAIEEIMVLAHDIGPIKQRERALIEAEARWRSAFDAAPVGMAEIASDGHFARVNPAMCAMLRYSAQQLYALTLRDISHPDDVDEAERAVAMLIGGTIDRYRIERRFLCADGSTVWCVANAVPVLATNGDVDHILMHCLDISELKRIEAELQLLADRDPLTGLLNRRSFEAALQRHNDTVRRYGLDGAAMVMDLDGLKKLNDVHGHEAGDQAILTVAELVRHRLRSTDSVARVGGDEFAILLPHCDRNQASTIAASIVELIRARSEADPTSFPITVSIGVAMFDMSDDSGVEVLAKADASMYVAKRAGGDRHVLAATATQSDVER